MFRPLTLVLLLLSAAAVSAAEPKPQPDNAPMPQGFFAFPLHWDDTLAGVATDVSFLNDKPAGKNGRILAKAGHFIEETTGRRIRFFGANMGAAQAFPEKADAELIAQRLAKAGVNIVRLHHLDNPWAIQNGGSIWAKDRPDRQELSPEQLDKLDYLIYCLKQQGIYSNINLKVSKELQPADDVPESIKQVKFTHQKRIDFFYPRMIELQKDYARKLLTHTNPYTKLAYTEDPTIAIVEINNENALLGYWTSTYGKDLDTLPKEFRDELAKQWTAWLKNKYGSDEKLTASWMQGVEPVGAPMLSAANTWALETHSPASALMETPLPGKEPTASPMSVEITQVDGTEWHIQAKLEGITLQDARQYTVSFNARADKDRTIGLGATVDQEDWHNVGLAQQVKLTKQDQHFAYTFTASSPVPSHTRLSFTIGKETGKIWISDLDLTPGVKGAGLKPGESIASGISIPVTSTKEQWKDWIHFLVDTEKAYSDTMYDLLKNELKLKADLALTQIDYGGTAGMNREQRMDYADAHAYWQHPSFPNADWSGTNWTIQNTPQISAMSDRAFGELGTLAMDRIAGKPFSVSEYDHPAPSEYVCEMLPTYAAFACVQDWDIIYTFATADYSANSKPDHITSYFDQNNHPAKWCFYPTAALIFRQGLIPPASEVATIHLPAPMWEKYPTFSGAWRALIPEGPLGFLTRRMEVSDQPLPAGDKPRVDITKSPGQHRDAARVQQLADKKAFIADSLGATVFAGYLGGQSLSAQQAQVTLGEFAHNFAAITLVATDREFLPNSARVLVTICGEVQNQGITWNANHNSIGANWGHGPTIAQFIPATISLETDGPRKVYALGSDGKRLSEVPCTRDGQGRISFRTAPEHATLLYEIAR